MTNPGSELPQATFTAATVHEAVLRHYSAAVAESTFVATVANELHGQGFSAADSIACVCSCRDEISQSLHARLQEQWPLVFNNAALSAMVSFGRTGLRAAQSHSPVATDGRERYIFFAMPHIGIGEGGEVGVVERVGREESSTACGALVAVLGELEDGTLDPALDPHDLELSLLRRRLQESLGERRPTDLVELTEQVYEIVFADLTSALEETVDSSRADYAVVTGIQVHGPDGRNYVAPRSGFSVVNGRRQALAL